MDPASKKAKVEAPQLTERQQLALLQKQSEDEAKAKKQAAAAVDDSDDDDEGGRAKRGDDDDDDEDEVDDDDEDEDEGGAPGVVAEFKAAQRWWEGSEGFDFTTSKTKQNEEDGMQVAGDPSGLVGKLVKRSFGRGVVSFGKVVGWFPPEEDGDEVSAPGNHIV
jgi:hypothetical protein